MIVQYTAGKNIPLTEYLGRHPITYTGESEIENKANRQKEIEVVEEFVKNQIYGLLVEFSQTVGRLHNLSSKPRHCKKPTNDNAACVHVSEIKPIAHLKLYQTAST